MTASTRLAIASLDCPECGALMELKNSRHGLFYSCTQFRITGCTGTHGAHPDGSPLGTPADRATKEARIRAHAAFDQLWTSGRMKRRRAYRWLRVEMNLRSREAHIGKFTAAQCDQLVALVERELATSTPLLAGSGR